MLWTVNMAQFASVCDKARLFVGWNWNNAHKVWMFVSQIGVPKNLSHDISTSDHPHCPDYVRFFLMQPDAFLARKTFTHALRCERFQTCLHVKQLCPVWLRVTSRYIVMFLTLVNQFASITSVLRKFRHGLGVTTNI